MDINSEIITTLLKEIEVIRRRKIVDYKNINLLQYIDPYDNLSKLSVHNNHLIFGRRGSGKTTLVLATLQRNKKDIASVQDVQSIKDFDSNLIIIKIVLKILFDIKEQFLDEDYHMVNNTYLQQYKGLIGVFNRITRKRNVKVMEKYNTNKVFVELLDDIIVLFDKLKDMPEVISYSYSTQDITTTKSNSVKSKELNLKGNLEFTGHLETDYKQNMLKVGGLVSATCEYMQSQKEESSLEKKVDIKSQNIKELRKKDILKETKKTLSFTFNEFNRIKNKNVVLYLDDFYQIPIAVQPSIIQYLHDIYKECENSSFCFKICSLPYRLRINEEGQVDLSYKDDFSPIKLDNDLSELNMTKEYLIRIITSLNTSLAITKQDIMSLFSSEEVVLFSIIATGGVPRDFLVMFADLIRTARSDNRNNIIKDHVYSVVKNLRDDKDNNIEYDSDIDPQKVREAIRILNDQVIEGLKTNVILYPKKLADKHEVLLKNLTNLRYLHIIKDSVSSENKKKEDFTAYLVDMSFYAANSRIKPGFDFRRFWESDKSSRLTQLRTSKIWNFPEDFLAINNIHNNTK